MQSQPRFSRLDPTIAKRHKRLWRPGYASISASESQFLKDLIDFTGARTILEIGTASGLSGCMIVEFVKDRSDAFFRTVDTAERFWNDKSQKTGFLLEREYQTMPIDAAILRGSSSLQTEEILGGRIADLVFIDANHQHPWPAIDSILNLPFLRRDGVMVHHDLMLHTIQDQVRGIGPKYLHDQLPDQLLIVSPVTPNIFAVRIPLDRATLADRIGDSFLLPWTNVAPVTKELVGHLGKFCDSHFGSHPVREKLETGFARFGSRGKVWKSQGRQWYNRAFAKLQRELKRVGKSRNSID